MSEMTELENYHTWLFEQIDDDIAESLSRLQDTGEEGNYSVAVALTLMRHSLVAYYQTYLDELEKANAGDAGGALKAN